ncbi:MAG: hypothetical protein ABIR18_00200 [Chitinophagaceae bacterium]
MIAKAMNERELVQHCMTELCKQAGFADTNHVVQRDLEFLCDSIESKTNILISLSTMRRLLNGQFSRLPQIATLNAMVMFLGYQNWQDFKVKKNVETSSTTNTTETFTTTTIVPAKKSSYAKYLVIAGALLLVTLGLLAMLKSGRPDVSNIESAKFSAVKTTNNDLPNTVVFNYNVDDVNADSFFIQQSWDKNRRVRVYKNNYTLTDIYYEPGYHTAKLIANEQIIKKMPVSIPTDRWLFYGIEKKTGANPKYITSTTGIQNGSLLLNKSAILDSEIDIEKDHAYVQSYFPSDIKYSSDNFKLKFRIRVNDLNNNACPRFMCEIFCQDYFMFFNPSLKGCASEISAEFGELFLHGQRNDLSALGINVREWQNMELIVKNKKATIIINGAEVFSVSYKESNGLITGLGFISNELCEVDFVDMQTLDGKVIYHNDFD